MADGEPEDWPSEPEQLRQLDRSLRCAVCYDLYTGPVVLPCSHSFCSRCIRESFNVRVRDGQAPLCPSCRSPCDQADLRPAAHLREAAAAWQAVRALLLSHHMAALHPQPQQQQQQHQQPHKSHSRSPSEVQIKQPEPQPPQQPHVLPKPQQAPPLRQQLRFGKRPRASLTTASAPAAAKRRAASAPANKPHECITISESSRSEGEDPGACSSEGDVGEGRAADAALDAADADEADWSDDSGDQDDTQPPSPPQQVQGASCRSVDEGRAQRPRRQGRRADSSTQARAGDGRGLRESAAAAACGDDDNDSDAERVPSSGRREPDGSGDYPCSSGDHQCGVGGDATVCDSDAVVDDSADSDFQPQDQGEEEEGGGEEDGGHTTAAPTGRTQKHHTAAGAGVCSGKENRGGKIDQQQQQQSLPQPAQQQQQQRQQPGYVACPVCGMSIREAFINSHIDSCLVKAGAGLPVPSAHTSSRQQQQQQPRGAPAPRPAGVDRVAGSSSAGPGSTSSSSMMQGRGRVRGGARLEAPPKLCFELLKERELKAKLTSLGLSSDGGKKACVERYTSFRNYVLSLKDSSSSLNLQQAAAEFTRQQQRISRAAARVQALDSSLVTAAVAGTGQPAGVPGAEQGGAAAIDNSFAALIKETRARQLQARQAQMQQQEQEQQTVQQQQQEQKHVAGLGGVVMTLHQAVGDGHQSIHHRQQQQQQVLHNDGRVVRPLQLLPNSQEGSFGERPSQEFKGTAEVRVYEG